MRTRRTRTSCFRDDKMTVQDKRIIESINSELLRNMVHNAVVEYYEKIQQIEENNYRRLCSKRPIDATSIQEIHNLKLEKSKFLMVIQDFTAREFYRDHSHKVARNDVVNLKSQIGKLKKHINEPFLTEDQIKCFG